MPNKTKTLNDARELLSTSGIDKVLLNEIMALALKHSNPESFVLMLTRFERHDLLSGVFGLHILNAAARAMTPVLFDVAILHLFENNAINNTPISISRIERIKIVIDAMSEHKDPLSFIRAIMLINSKTLPYRALKESVFRVLSESRRPWPLAVALNRIIEAGLLMGELAQANFERTVKYAERWVGRGNSMSAFEQLPLSELTQDYFENLVASMSSVYGDRASPTIFQPGGDSALLATSAKTDINPLNLQMK